MRRKSFKAGERIFNEGENSESAYLIFSGHVEIRLMVEEGERVVTTLGKGEVFGEMGLIDEGPRSASAVAASDTICLAMTCDELMEQLEHNPKEAVAFIKALIKRLRETDKRLAIAGG